MPPSRIVATFYPSSSVISSTACSLSTRGTRHLVVGKLNAITVYSILPDKLQLTCSYELTGKLKTIKAIPVSGSHRSNILVLLDHPDPELLIFSYTDIDPDANVGRLELRSRDDLYERGCRPAEHCTDVIVHPNGKVAAVSCYGGRLKILTLKAGCIDMQTDVQIGEINLLSLAFLPVPDPSYALALLHVDHKEQLHLLSRDLSVDKNGIDLSLELSVVLPPTTISLKTHPFPTEILPQLVSIAPQADFLGGILILGGKKITLFELSTIESQLLHKGKRKRLDKRKSGQDEDDQEKAKQKEKEREQKKRTPTAEVEWPWSQVSAVCPLGDNSAKFLVGDTFGRLALLSAENLKREFLLLLPIGETSPAQTISYLDNQVLYIGSHFGDSQVIKLHQNGTSDTEPTLPMPPGIKNLQSSDKGKGRATEEDHEELFDESLQKNGRIYKLKGKYLSVLHTFENIAPIADATLVDLDNSGQKQIVTCSGDRSTGSINIVRMGANFQELAALPGLERITGIWPIRSSFYAVNHTHILASTLSETHVFRIESGHSLSYLDADNSFALDAQTICVHNLIKRDTSNKCFDSSYVIQVTPKAASILEFDTSSGQWWEKHVQRPAPGDTYVAASVNSSQVLLASSGGNLDGYVIEVNNNSPVLRPCILKTRLDYTDHTPNDPTAVTYRHWLRTEISAISVTPLKDSEVSTRFFAVAFWTTNQIKIYKYTPNGFKVQFQSMPLPATVRSLLFYDLGLGKTSKDSDHHPCLFAGLANGSIVSFSLSFEWKTTTNDEFMVLRGLKDMKIVSLGETPVSLSACPVKGKRAVIATGTRTAVLTWERSRVRHSPVTLKDVTAVHALDAVNYPASLILANATGIKIGRVQDTDKMHIRSIPLGLDKPYKIAHVPSLKAFGVVTDRTEPFRPGEADTVLSSLKLIDDQNFKTISSYECSGNEQAMSLSTISLSIADEDESFFCLGTAVINPQEVEPRRGRIVVLGAHQAKSLSVSVSEEVGGCVYALTTISGLLAAAVNSSVVLFHLDTSRDENTGVIIVNKLHRISEWNHNYLVTNIVSYGDNLIVSDQFCSVSLLQLSDGNKLMTLARDFSPLWPLSIEAFSEKQIIGADYSMNLFSFTMKQSGGRKVLRRDGYYHLGEGVTRFLRGSVTLPTETTTESGMYPTHLFCTASGRIGVIIDISDDQLSNDLSLLEKGLTSLQIDKGQESHAKHRAPRDSRGRTDAAEAAYGFIDGDYLEKLLTFMDESPEEEVDKVFNTSVEGLCVTSERGKIRKALESLQNMH
ncbi:uv-damaged dna-binding [Moniliophthora roreri MCA 2997]|uniref:Uv-damaged dna-binding n=1 Tax=Moniliophthora roreri (strain MCA 2997) TaxID=1381753 RepID=V2WXP7_MONRO|nr:uv-damaged dna-binding [Moniliophthora roreri MCA 2997]KAI3603086.1 uv-damaged dna-binding [Moniliophthora roreri]